MPKHMYRLTLRLLTILWNPDPDFLSKSIFKIVTVDRLLLSFIRSRFNWSCNAATDGVPPKIKEENI